MISVEAGLLMSPGHLALVLARFDARTRREASRSPAREPRRSLSEEARLRQLRLAALLVLGEKSLGTAAIPRRSMR